MKLEIQVRLYAGKRMKKTVQPHSEMV